MDINRAFTYFKEDEEWVNKFLIGSILFLTIIGSIPAMGWLIEIMRRKLHDENAKLPDWADFGKYTIDGLKMILLGLVWTSPLILLSCLQFALISGVIIFFAGSEMDDQSYFALIQGINLLSLCSYPIIFIYSLGVGILYYPAYGIFAETNSLQQAIDPRNAFRALRANLGDYIVIIAIGYGIGFLAPLGLLLCIVGIFPLYIYFYTILGDLAAAAYNRAKTNLAEQTAA